MTAYRKATRGFTLVEILIVVIILGILAAIVIPQFTNASQDARKSNMASQLQTLRAQIELFKLQHQDKPPTLVADQWAPFINKTDPITMAVIAPGATDYNTYPGPYFQQPSVNPLTDSSSFAAAEAVSVGWKYDDTTGEIHGIAISSTGPVVTDDGVYIYGAATPTKIAY
jgi:general secretion pathway protein G